MLISAYWLIPATWLGVVVGVFVMCLMRAASQPDARLDRAEDDPRTQQSQGAVSVSHGERN